jgi:hypothetical protein
MSTTSDDFVAKAKERIEKLSYEITQLELQEEGVRRRRLELQRQADEWKRSVTHYAEVMGIDVATPGQLVAGLDTPTGTIPQLTDRYLIEHDGIAKVSDITEWIVETGRLQNDPERAQRHYGQVYTALLRHPARFENVDRGTFRLRPGSTPLSQKRERA